MIKLSIKADFREVHKKLDRLSFEMQSKVVPAALNKVAAKANTEMVRQITGEFNIKASDVRGELRIWRAKRSAGSWFAVLQVATAARRRGALNLIRFVERSVTLAEARRRKNGGTANQLRVQIKKSGGRRMVKGAFIATNQKTSGTAVFMREGKDRYPIKPLSTIGVGQMFNTRRIQRPVLERINREMEVEFDRAIKAALSGAFR